MLLVLIFACRRRICGSFDIQLQQTCIYAVIADTYVLLAVVFGYSRDIVGFEIQLLQIHTCLLLASKFSYGRHMHCFQSYGAAA